MDASNPMDFRVWTALAGVACYRTISRTSVTNRFGSARCKPAASGFNGSAALPYVSSCGIRS